MNPKIHVLILNWNGGKYIRECIYSIKANNYSNYIITVVDNYSTDDSLLKIKDENINIISHINNYKYAKGYNKAIFELKNDDSDYYLLLNNDTICDDNLLESFAQAIKGYGSNCIMGAKILYAKNKNTIWYAGGKFGLFNFFVSHKGIRNIDNLKYDNDYLTDYITGCCLLISKNNFHKLNGFDESFNMYGEDVDLSIRAQNIGLKCYYIAKAKLWHNVSASYGGHYSLSKNISKINSLIKLIIKYPKKIILGL
tara:strand:- start:323 stop:1084 length:762 start_codon:yes stop_codon:yes gene_type:complete